MARDWEAVLTTWGKPASESEDEKRKRTERAITAALNADSAVKDLPINVYAKGSYANRTNVRGDSDVDVNVEYTGMFYWDTFNWSVSREELGITPASGSDPQPAQLRSLVSNALVGYFGSSAVSRGNKAIAIHESGSRIAADVVPCYRYYRYDGPSIPRHQGTKLFAANGEQVLNWPQQHYDNGVAKNKATSKRFKAMVRCLKRLENEMVENGQAREVPSYLLECLAYNVPVGSFSPPTLKGNLRNVLAHIWNNTRTQADCAEWEEVNGLKYLFKGSHPWTWQDAHAFADSAWNYIGFE